ncbi:MAG: M18 family aminopeptidase [Planctomycetota bacterium]
MTDQRHGLEFAERLAAFIDASPSPYHVVAEVAERLIATGFTELDERDAFQSVPVKGFARRGGSIHAWFMPPGAGPEVGFRVLGAHTDSPNLRVKPQPDTGRVGVRQLGVEVYGGALLNSWLDRDLGLSGRVYLETAAGTLEERLFLDSRPLARVAQLAIHLDREVNEKGVQLNRQSHLAPLWGLGDREHSGFRHYLAGRIGADEAAVRSFDVMFHDIQPSRVLGRDREFLAAPRLDNLCSCFCGLDALIAIAKRGEAAGPVVLALFDHEEVGSASRGGAAGPPLEHIMERLVLARGGGREDLLRALAASFCVSADMAHATHPNYVERHEPDHLVFMNRGPVLKVNQNQRYATEALTAARFESACRAAGAPMQSFVTRTDLGCGSTIGPLTATRLGLPTVDVGVPQLSMHSSRELCGVLDPALMTDTLEVLLRD